MIAADAELDAASLVLMPLQPGFGQASRTSPHACMQASMPALGQDTGTYALAYWQCLRKGKSAWPGQARGVRLHDMAWHGRSPGWLERAHMQAMEAWLYAPRRSSVKCISASNHIMMPQIAPDMWRLVLSGSEWEAVKSSTLLLRARAEEKRTQKIMAGMYVSAGSYGSSCWWWWWPRVCSALPRVCSALPRSSPHAQPTAHPAAQRC